MAVITASDRTYTLHGTTRLTFADAVARVRETLKEEGFGVLTEIDVQGTLREKLDVEMEPYLILGACNPTFAHRALQVDPSVSLLLPCNVALEPADGGTHVAAVDPRELMSDPRFAELAEEASARLATAIGALATATAHPVKE